MRNTQIWTRLLASMIVFATGCQAFTQATQALGVTKSSPLIKPGVTAMVPETGRSTLAPTPAPTLRPTLTPTRPGEALLLAVGDIADCASEGDEATAALVEQHPDAAVAVLGDNVYERGTPAEWENCYEASWGKFKDRTYPSVGNHEYLSLRAAPYYEYFGEAAGEPHEGYYSYDLGAWHIVVVNSNCAKVGGCTPGTPQYAWLKRDLEANPSECSLAYWHHPRYSSGQWGNFEQMEDVWRLLYQHGAELVLSGHDHNYERFAPKGPDGVLDPDQGIRQIVVGTGGKSMGDFPAGRPIEGSEVRDNSGYGILKLVLSPTSYTWEFLPVEGETLTDAGETACHPPVNT